MESDSDRSNGNTGWQQESDSASRLPGDKETWERCDLGPSLEWPEALRAFSITISSLTYPTAIFWGERLVLLHNRAWKGATGVDQQGQSQRGNLPPDAWNALSAAIRGGKPKRVKSHLLLQTDEPEGKEPYTVLLSPLFSEDGGETAGILAQLMPKSTSQPPNAASQHSSKDSSETANQDSAQQLADITKLNGLDNVPLDEHPFFHRFAEMLPTGLAILDRKAQAIFVNQHFYQLTTHPENDKAFRAWPHSIHPEDYDRVMDAYEEAFKEQKQLRTEFRSTGQNHPWRLLLLTPLGDENLKHVSLREYGGFICSIVDISSEKSAEIGERKAAKEAQERKEQQERFIDMISHEIRNPLSAILHCTEDIEDATKSGQDHVDVEAITSAVETINLCISHQRNIVDDVLSFSKLDSSMLTLVPKPCEASRELANSLKMFQPELRKQNITFGYCIDESYKEIAVEWVLADLARIGQILVNLVTNAIKFTVRKAGHKELTVSIGASRERPTSYPPNMVFFNADDLSFRLDATNSSDWGNGEVLYLMVAVRDTGIGISEENQMKLFERFRQATPKTGEIYGGSGLGLNISRKLCHLHGGEIGVASQEGSGSTFGFFFKVKRSDAPQGDGKHQTSKEQIEEDAVASQIDSRGLTSPEELDRSLIPESLKTPPVKRVMEAARSDVELDDRFEKTAEIAAQVEEPEADTYGNSQRPKISKAHKSGSYWQSGEITQRHTPNRSSTMNAMVSETGRRPHVLLAEDNIINQKIVFRKLESHGFNVTTANNGREAVERMRDSPKLSSDARGAFDIILMDQEMPIMDGNSAAREIRKLETDNQIEHIPILGVTANARDDQQNEMLDNGMDLVITKPYKIDELVMKIHRLLGNLDPKSEDAG